MRTVVLMVLDGWGIGGHDQSNPIWQTQTPTFDWVKKNFPSLALQASGIAVGLPWGEEGNSEVGHLTMGAGKVLYQNYPRISMAIRDGSFFTNAALLGAFEHAQKNNGKVHLIGLLTDKNVHASMEHLEALLKLAKMKNLPQIYLDMITDGKDAGPKSAQKFFKELENKISEIGIGTVTSVSGRFYAMDREEHWVRTEKIYRLLTEGGITAKNPEEALNDGYKKELTDEFIQPTLILQPDGNPVTIQNNDAVIFFNFREDSLKQLVEPFFEQNFSGFEHAIQPQNLYIATMTSYNEGWPVGVCFPPEKINHPLAKILSENGKRQLHLAESERAAHVTYFFNGMNPAPNPEEYWIIAPSPTMVRYDEKPQLAAEEVFSRLSAALDENIYDFILVNFANADLMGHSGNFEAAREAISLIDRILNRLASACLNIKATLIVTSDHGNVERMIDPLTGRPETSHNLSLVPFYVIDDRLSRPRSPEEIAFEEKGARGGLSDIAPTVLDFLGLQKPVEMTGESLVPYLK